jgi:hypothetical protein
LPKPIQLASEALANSLGADDGKGDDWLPAALGVGPGLQDGLSEKGHEAVTASFRSALHLDDVRVLAALSQQIGAKVAGWRWPPDLPAGTPEQVGDALLESFASGYAQFGCHDPLTRPG